MHQKRVSLPGTSDEVEFPVESFRTMNVFDYEMKWVKCIYQ